MVDATGGTTFAFPNNDPHTRTGSGWLCPSPEGQASGGFEVIALANPGYAANAVAPVPQLVADSGVSSLGHRSNILLTQTSEVGIGESTHVNVMQFVANWSLTASTDTAWPAPGYTPYEVASTTTANIWAFYPSTGDASAATMTVTKNGSAVTTSRYGSPWNPTQRGTTTALAWTMPALVKPAAGTTDDYKVKISGITGRTETSTTYDVYIFNAAEVTIGSVAISGSPQFGQTLTATVSGVSPVGASLSYQWKRNNTAITGATANTYTLTAADAGANVTVTVTGAYSQAGLTFTPATVTSSPLAIPALPVVAPGTVTISGLPQVDQTLTVSASGWTPTGLSLAYQWYAGGVLIPGATGTIYVPTAGDVAKSVSVTVTGSMSGYTSASKSASAGIILPPDLVAGPSVIGLGTKAGQAMPVIVEGFQSGESVRVSLEGPLKATLGTVVMDNMGEAAASFKVPVNLVSGTYTLSAVGLSSSYSATYTIKITGTGGYVLLKLNANGGKVSVPAKSVAYKGKYGTLAKPTRAGYTFTGWYTAKSGGSKVTSATKMTTKTTKTIYAHWKAKSYKVSFNGNGGTVSKKSKTVTMGKAYGTLPKVSARTGYTFAGWYTSKTGGTKVSSSTKFVSAANQTLYAHWTAKSYTVNLNPQLGTVTPTSIKVTYNSTYAGLPDPSRSGYAFVGWYTKATGGTLVTTSSIVKITATQTLYAHWGI